MKSKVIQIPAVLGSRDQDFPCLKLNINQGYIVLFTSMFEGTVVHEGSADFPLGYHSNNWSGATTKFWEDIDKDTSVILLP